MRSSARRGRDPFVGRPFALPLDTSLYLLSVLGIGLVISTIYMTRLKAFATNFFIINPAFILSRFSFSFSFPIASMPFLMQRLSKLNPHCQSPHVPHGVWA